MAKKKTTDALDLIDREFPPTERNLQLREKARVAGDVAQLIYNARTEAGLSQRDLAKLVGTHASVICKLEDAAYEGHSLSMLRRVSAALGKEVRVELVDIPKRRRVTKKKTAKGRGQRGRAVTKKATKKGNARRATTAK